MTTGNAVGPLAYANCGPRDDVSLLCEIYAKMTDTTERTTRPRVAQLGSSKVASYLLTFRNSRERNFKLHGSSVTFLERKRLSPSLFLSFSVCVCVCVYFFHCADEKCRT